MHETATRTGPHSTIHLRRYHDHTRPGHLSQSSHRRSVASSRAQLSLRYVDVADSSIPCLHIMFGPQVLSSSPWELQLRGANVEREMTRTSNHAMQRTPTRCSL